ncbi:MAG: alpha-L-arabinofuranosidase C-terminal domain-containing protein [Verrucomicrobiota bacterium]
MLILSFLCFHPFQLLSEGAETAAVIHSQPLHGGRISPMLFGNFVELLDDVVPGMWAEMLNDRSFEGVNRAANWSYYDGKPDFCDREWDPNPTWSRDTENPFNGARSARLTAARHHPASLTQSGLAVKRGVVYEFSGWFRADSPKLAAAVLLKTLLPTGDWMTLASAKLPLNPAGTRWNASLPGLGAQWHKYSAHLTSKGQTDRVVFELRLEGEGSAWADKLSLMPADNLMGWRPDVVQAIKDVHPAIVRWGGSACDPGEYRWKEGIGSRDRRTPFPNKPWGRIDPNDVGIDEFCQFCELAGVEPLICLSFSDGPESAADLVAYCNGETNTLWGAKRAANGHAAPYHVKYWQVGNEISGDNENYLGRFGEFVRAMKEADPGVLLMASFPTQKLLDRVGKDLAYVGPHHYTADFAGCDREFANLSRIIDTTPGCAQIRIAVTEWNVTGGDWGLGRGKMLTLESALLNARYLHVLMRHSDKAEIACRSNLANSYAGAIIETSPAGLLKRPSFYVMQLYARHARPIPLRLEQSNGALDLFACASPNGKSLCLFAVNPGTAPVEFSYRFDGFVGAVRAASAEVSCDTLDARQRDVMNHWEAPDRVKTVSQAPPQNPVILPALSATAIECEVK